MTRRTIVPAVFLSALLAATTASAQRFSQEALESVEGGVQGHFSLLALCGAPTGPLEDKVTAALLGAGAEPSQVEAMIERAVAYAEAEARKAEGMPDTFGMKAQMCSPQGLADMEGMLDLTLENLPLVQALQDHKQQLEAAGALPAAAEPEPFTVDDDLEPYAGERLSAEWLADFGAEMGGGAAALDACGLDSDDLLDDFEQTLRREGAERSGVRSFREAFEDERQAALEEIEQEPGERALLDETICRPPGVLGQFEVVLRSSFNAILTE